MNEEKMNEQIEKLNEQIEEMWQVIKDLQLQVQCLSIEDDEKPMNTLRHMVTTAETSTGSANANGGGRKPKSEIRSELKTLRLAVSRMKAAAQEGVKPMAVKSLRFHAPSRIRSTGNFLDKDRRNLLLDALKHLGVTRGCKRSPLAEGYLRMVKRGDDISGIEAAIKLLNMFSQDQEWCDWAAYTLENNDDLATVCMWVDISYGVATPSKKRKNANYDFIYYKTTPFRRYREEGHWATVYCQACGSIQKDEIKKTTSQIRCYDCLNEKVRVFQCLEDLIKKWSQLQPIDIGNLEPYEERVKRLSRRDIGDHLAQRDHIIDLFLKDGACLEITRYMKHYWPTSSPKGKGAPAFFPRLVEAFHQTYAQYEYSVADIGGAIIDASSGFIYELMQEIPMKYYAFINIADKYDTEADNHPVYYFYKHPGLRRSDAESPAYIQSLFEVEDEPAISILSNLLKSPDADARKDIDVHSYLDCVKFG